MKRRLIFAATSLLLGLGAWSCAHTTAPAPVPAVDATATGLPAVVETGAPPPAESPEPSEPPKPEMLTGEDWARATLEGMSLTEKAAQMVMVRVFGRYGHPDSAGYRALIEAVDDLAVGGVIVFDSDLETIPRLLDELQTAAEVPLLVSADLERGMDFRVQRGVVSLPYAMAFGATRSEDAARFLGEVTAREGRALGIHWAFAPVVDVNNNPGNPVINLRSFGEDSDLVSRLGVAFIAGLAEGGMLSTAKHFPGHGDTAIDSHVSLPTIGVDRARLDAVELPPFRRAIEAGVDSVMLAHVAVPAVDPSGAPATLSPPLAVDLLRGELGFDGLMVTDAMEMGGVGSVWVGAATVRAIQAGADVVLLPPDTRVAIQSIVRAVEEGQLDEARIDASVARVLETKARLGLHRERFVDRGALTRDVARPEDLARAAEIARASVTLVRNEGGVLPLAAEEPNRVLHLVMSGSASRPVNGSVVTGELRSRQVEHRTHVLGAEVAATTARRIVATVADGDYTHVLVSAYARVPWSPSRPALPATHRALLDELTAGETPVIVAAFGSPYLLSEVLGADAYLCTYGWPTVSQRAAVAAVFGESDVGGKLPVTLPDLASFGEGIEIPRRAMSLAPPAPGTAGRFAEVDRLLTDFVGQGAFPGAVVAVGHRGELAHLAAFGSQTYDPGSPPVTVDTIYDVASLTKVIATTTMAMMLVDEGRLDLDAPVVDFLPLFAGPGKEKVTIRHLLTHSSGVDWWAPLYEDLEGPAEYLARIQAMDLVYEPGSKSVYSDLGLILLGEILERVSGRPLDEFVADRVFAPLGMTGTGFRPDPSLLGRIAPTEYDEWRGRVVHGEVHDENAFALGGVAPHAGLFSTAGDLARFMQMIVYGGVFEHRRLISKETVGLFTRRANVTDSTRALGWDTKSPQGSSAGTLFSPESFGHTGFTGTSIWVDPRRELFLILLTNRVHPTRDNKMIRQVRPAVADAVVRALGEG